VPLVDKVVDVVEQALLSRYGYRFHGSFTVSEPTTMAVDADYSTNAALVLAKRIGVNPRTLAEEIAQQTMDLLGPLAESVTVAGPGFINFRLSKNAFIAEIQKILAEEKSYFAEMDAAAGGRVQVEFVSANPTGPLHIGNGWLGTYGDALARLLEFRGYEVVREYYVNDTGGQIRTLGESILAAKAGREIPEGGYKGDYIYELARKYSGPDDRTEAGRWAVPIVLAEIRSSLERLKIYFDEWYSQASIEESGKVAAVVELLGQRDATFEEGDALWFRSTQFGDSRDRVLRKSNGDYTYLAGDIAYHYDKLVTRGFDLVIDVWGADHHGQVASLKAAMRALGIDENRLEIRLGQMVSLLVKGEAVKFSKREGTAIPLTWLLDELGPDAARLLVLSSSIDRAAQIDIEKTKSHSLDNPVYYMQYANARIAAIFRRARQEGIDAFSSDDLQYLGEDRELQLMRKMVALPEVIKVAASERAPHKLTSWLLEASAAFHGFYHDLSVLSASSEDLRRARLGLCRATQIALLTAFELLGVTPVEEM
jgi:arginyl-tRNA synthetase